MTETLIFATNNAHKVQEINAITNGRLHIVSLREAGIVKDIPEPFDTLRENAYEKCRVIAELTGQPCFSEDTGLEVDALNGAPGVKSARYAGEQATADDNIDKLLNALADNTLRAARFRTVICFLQEGAARYFEGVCEGHISHNRMGIKGFGYDPVFIPAGFERSFAQMEAAEKNALSHRKKAFDKLFLFLKEN
jgi:XTP/dITP diphosphohydrolase